MSSIGFVRLGTTVKAITTGDRHNCAQFINNNVRCWGDNNNGQLGLGHTNVIGDNETPISQPYVDVGAKISMIASGGSHTCVVKPENFVSCWGSGSLGQLGYGNTNNIGDDESPASVGNILTGTTARIVQIASGESHTCILTASGRVKCWGSNSNRQLGAGLIGAHIGDDETPATVGFLNIGEVVTQISAGGDHTCALLESKKLKCWGRNDNGQLGLGNTTTLTTAIKLHPYVDVGEDVNYVSASKNSTCVVTATNKVKCWSLNDAGQLGQGNMLTVGATQSPSAVPEVALPGPAILVKAGDKHTCAMMEDKNLICWGSGASGKLGYGNILSIGDDETLANASTLPGLNQEGITYDEQDRLIAFGTKPSIKSKNQDGHSAKLRDNYPHNSETLCKVPPSSQRITTVITFPEPLGGGTVGVNQPMNFFPKKSKLNKERGLKKNLVLALFTP